MAGDRTGDGNGTEGDGETAHRDRSDSAAEVAPGGGGDGFGAIERIRWAEDRGHYRFVVGLFLAVGVGNGLLLLLGGTLPGPDAGVAGVLGAAGVAVRDATNVAVPVGLVAGALAGVRFESPPRDAGVLVGFAAANGAAVLVAVVFVFALPLALGGSGGGFPGSSPDATAVLGSLLAVVVSIAVLAGLTAYVARDYGGD